MMLGEFQDGLSRNLQYSPRNTETHIMYKNTLAPFTVMHVVYFLSVIVLHRAYIPFLPLRCSEPVGPLDDPIYAADKAGTPEGFWRDSARELFRAARQMIDLAINCQDRGALVENPLTGFAIYNAAFMGVYATHFPHMDQEGVLSSKPGSDNQIYTRKALDIVREMRPRLKMASTWFRTLNRLHSYFSKVKRDFRRHSHSLDLSNGIRPLWSVGGPEDFKFLEKVFFDYGTIEDQLPETPDDEHADRTTNLSDSGTSNAVKSDPDLDGPAASTASARRESWVPINNSPGMPPPSSDPDRRPSLPLPPRPMNSQSPFPLPSLHPDGPGPGAGPGPAPNPTSHLFTTTTSTSSSSPPSLPSLPSVSYPPSTSTTTPNHATGSGPAPTPRLQPLNSWMPRPAPPPTPYSQALPPINASTATIAPSSQQPLPSLRHQASPPIPSPLSPAIDLSVWSCSLVGEDVLAFLEGCGGEKAGSSGWLGAVWGSWK